MAVSAAGEIPVRVADAEQSCGSGRVLAILSEVESMLTRLADSGTCGSIDLRNLLAGPGDRETLRRILAEGEVSAVVRALGETQVHETAVRGVWWVTHCAEDGKTVAEFIEVTHVPEILKTPPDDIADGLEVLFAKRRALDG